MEERLTFSDLQTVVQELNPVASHWKAIGVCLQLDVNEIEEKLKFSLHAIDPTAATEGSESVPRPSPEDYLAEMLQWWLNRVSPQPTWRSVVDALRSTAVGEVKLANQLELKYCSPPSLPGQQDPVSEELLEESEVSVSPGYNLLCENYDKIVSILSQYSDPSSLAERLYSAQFIDKSAMEEAGRSGEASAQRISKLMSAVLDQVENNSSKFDQFVSMMEEWPEAKTLLEPSQVTLLNVNFEKAVLTKTFESSGGVFDASESGVIVSIPPGAVSSGVIATVSIKLCLSESFQFPEDCEPVSPIYLVETNKKFLKPVEVVIRHDTVLQSEEDCKSVVILTAALTPDYRGSTPSYPFQEISGGVFEVGGRTGRFTVSQLGLFAAVGHHTTSTGKHVSSPKLHHVDRPSLIECVRFRGRDRRINIPSEIGTYYMRFGLLLLQDDTGVRLSNLVRKHHGDGEQINSEILQEWIAGEGKHPVTWKTLTEVLLDIDCNTLAAEIEAVLDLPDEEIAGEVRLTEKDLAILTDVLKGAVSNWKMIGLALGFQDAELTAIERKPLLIPEGPTGYFREMLSRWLKCAPPNQQWPTLGTLALALTRTREESLAHELKEQYLAQNGKPVGDSSVTSSEGTAGVTEEGRPKMADLAVVPIQPSQWYTLGLALGLEEEVLLRIEVDQSRKLAKCKRAMFRKWLELNPTASWKDVVEALTDIGEQVTAEKVRVEFYPPQVVEDDHHADGSHGDDDLHSNEGSGGGGDEVDDGVCDLDLELLPEGIGATKTLLDTPEDSGMSSVPLPYVVEDSPAVSSTPAGAEVASKLSEVGKRAARMGMTLELRSREESDAPSVDERGLLGGHVLSPATGEITVIEEERSSHIKIGSPHSVHEYRTGPQSFLSTKELTKWTPKPDKLLEDGRAKSAPATTLPPKQLEEKRAKSALATTLASEQLEEGQAKFVPATILAPKLLDKGRAKSAPDTTVTPPHTHLHADSPTNTFQAPKPSLLQVVQQNVEADSPTRGNSESSHVSSSSDVYHSLTNEGFEHIVGSGSPFVSSELSMPRSIDWKREHTPLTSSSDWKRDPSSVTSSLTGSSITAVSGGGSESSISTLSVQSASSDYSGVIETAKADLLEAVLSGDAPGVGSVLSSGRVGVDTQLKDGHTALMLAAVDGMSEIVRLLLEQYSTGVDEKDPDGRTALHLAASCGNYEVVKILVSAFADVNSTSNDGTPMLLYPSSKGFSMVTEYLLKNGAKPNRANELGVTPLIAAARRGQKDVVKVLLQHGANVTAVSRDTSQTALQEAIEGNHTEIITMLVKATAEAGETSRGLFKCTTAEAVRKLVKKGANVDERRGDGATPLTVHTELGNGEVVKELIRLNANVDLQDEHGQTALMKACRRGNVEVARLLVAGRAIPDLKSKSGLTSLMYAIQNEHVTIVKELLLAGADSSARDRSGRSVMDMANDKQNEDIIDLLSRQTAVSNPNDPFVQLLSGYLQQKTVTDRGAEGPDYGTRKPSPRLTRKKEAVIPGSVHAPPPPATDNDSTLKDQLSKCWKRIADLETRIHDLTLQATMEIPESTDLTYLDRGRLEEEYRKLKELKKKAEHYAVDAKQTAQRLSAENFKLKEDLSRERHHNELTRKNMIREMEQKLDKSATALDRADARLEVFEQEVTERALQMIRHMPAPAMTLQLSKEVFQPARMKEFILKESVRANVALVGVAGLPYSGKSTLIRNVLELKHTGKSHGGLDAFEAVVLKDKLNNHCQWTAAKKEEAEVMVVSAALAQVCAKSHSYPSFQESRTSGGRRPSETIQTFGDPSIDQYFDECYVGVRKLMRNPDDQHKLMSASLTLLNVWDVGVNRTVFEILSKVAGKFQNLLLLNVLSLEKDCDHLYKPPHLGDNYYEGRYIPRGDDKRLMALLTSLHYFVRCIFLTNCRSQSTIVVGTHADKFQDANECSERKENVFRSVRARAEELGISKALSPQMLAVDARDRATVVKDLRAVLEETIERDHQFEKEIPLSWIFLRVVLHRMNKMYMTKKELASIANKCGVKSGDEVEEFLKLFLTCGSILYSPTEDCPVLHDCVILQPVAFIQAFDRLYYVQYDQDIPTELRRHVEKTRNGYVTEQLVKHIWPKENQLYLQALKGLGLVVEVSDIREHSCPLGLSTCYFMPTLRPLYYSELPSPDSESLIVVTSNLDIIPYDLQSQFVIHMKNTCKRNIEVLPTEHFNMLHFCWSKQPEAPASKEVSADIYIRFLGEIAEVEVIMDSQDYHRGTICSIMKTACIDIFQRKAKEIPGMKYKLAFVCPKSEVTQPHYVHFNVGVQNLYCSKCCDYQTVTPHKKIWMQAGVESALSQLLNSDDSVTHAEVAAIAENLSHLTWEKQLEFANRLHFTTNEVHAKLQYCPPDELLLILLLEWRKRYPMDNKSLLAKALAKCGEYSEAEKLDPSVVVMSPKQGRVVIPEPLSDKDLGAITQTVRDWRELGRNLQISENQLNELDRAHRTNSERCSSMLAQWCTDMQARPPSISPREQLAEILLRLGYNRLAEFLTIEVDSDVLFFK